MFKILLKCIENIGNQFLIFKKNANLCFYVVKKLITQSELRNKTSII